MKFAVFAGEDGKPVYINPMLVSAIRELNDRLCLVQVGESSVNIPLPVAVVVDDLEKATYSYAVGAAGTTGTSGAAGGAGGSGFIQR
jgi:hypothetical protein